MAMATSRDRFDIDDLSEAPEVRRIEREEPMDAMLEHRRDNVGVVDLATAAGMGSEQVKEAVEHTRPFLGDVERCSKFFAHPRSLSSWARQKRLLEVATRQRDILGALGG